MNKLLLVFAFTCGLSSSFGYCTYSDSSKVFTYHLCIFKKGKPGYLIKNEKIGIADTSIAFVSGVIYANGEPCSFANISFTNSKGIIFVTNADVDGNYKISLASDKYEIKYFIVGFNEFNIKKLRLSNGQIHEVTLDIGGPNSFNYVIVSFDHEPTEKELKAKEKQLSESE